MNIWRNLTHAPVPAAADTRPVASAEAELEPTGAGVGHPAEASAAVSTSAGARRIPRGQLPAGEPRSAAMSMMSPATEVAEAQARLDALDPELVPDNLAQAVRDAARKAYVARSIREWIRDAEEAVSAALAAADPIGAIAASDELVAGERIIPMLPGTSIAGEAVAEALGLAAGKLRQALGVVHEVPEVAYSLERAAWESLPDLIRAASTPPVAMQQDLEAAKVREVAVERRAVLLAGIAGWEASCGHPYDVLSLLAAAGSYLEQLAELHEPLQAATTTVEAANAAREAAGVRWEPPRDRTSSAIARLAKSTADRMAAAPTP